MAEATRGEVPDEREQEGAAGRLSRRGFLGVVAAAAVAGATGGLARRAAALAPAIRARRLGAIGIQLYTVRGLMDHDVEGTLAALARIGYREVEPAGLHGKTAKAMRAILDRHQLDAPSSHIPLEDIRARWPQTLDDAATLGQSFIVCPWIDDRYRTPDGLRGIADEFNRAAEQARAHGIRFGYHNHDWEFTPLAGTGQLPYDLLLAETDPELVAFEMDLYWITKGGQDPLAYFAKHPGRFPLVHVKDMARDGAMVDVGQGTIDWAAIFRDGARAGIEHQFVEHDDPPHPLEDARISYEYLRALVF